MHQMEKICMQQIKAQELNANDDYKAMREDKIIIEKTLHQMARERFNESKKKSEEEVSKEAAANDFLYPYLEKKVFITFETTFKLFLFLFANFIAIKILASGGRESTRLKPPTIFSCTLSAQSKFDK